MCVCNPKTRTPYCSNCFPMNKPKIRGFEQVREDCQTMIDETFKLPLRGTKTSAGYDFFAVHDLVIRPQETVRFSTDVKAYMQEDEALLIDIRSSQGIKNDLMISNTLGLVDSDYYGNPDNDGNIGIFLRNLKPPFELINFKLIDGDLLPVVRDTYEENTVLIKAGDRVAQGFFIKFLESDNCNTVVQRLGGTGSTNGK